MPIIQKRKYKINNITYYQYRLNIPTKIIDLLRWEDSRIIEFTILDGNLICKKFKVPKK